MTPRALLMAIGATAIGFTIAIVAAAKGAPSTLMPHTAPVAAVTADAASGEAVRTLAWDDPAAELAELMGATIAAPDSTWNANCRITL